MKKKGLVVLLALSVFALTGCGTKDTDVEATTEVTTEATTEATTEEASEEKTEATTEEKTTEQSAQTTEAVTTQTTENTSGSGVMAISPEDATAMLMVTLGERDEETGNEYSYGYIENVQIDGVTYLVFDWRWLVDDHTSRLGNLFVTADGSKIYEGIYSGPENSQVFLDNPLN